MHAVSRTTLGLILAFGMAALPAACGRKPSGGGAGIDPAAAQEADTIFKTRCTPCHGAGGHGDGSASATLNPKPRNFTDKSWQKSVTNEHIEKIIQYGGAAVGKSAAMPANPDLQAKPKVVSALRAKVRSFGR